MWRSVLLGAMLFCCSAMAANAEERSFEFSGEVSETLAYRIADSERLTQAKTQVKTKAELTVSPDSRFTAVARGFYDFAYDRYEFAPSAISVHRDEIVLREFYWDQAVGPVSLRLGKQQVTWGEGDYFRVVDVVNPLDMRDFLLTYFDDYQEGRLPLWMANLTYHGENAETQLLLVPDFEPTLVAEPTADFAPPALTALYAAAPVIEHREPEDQISDAAAGMRMATTIGQTDAAFYAYYGWNPDPLPTFTPTTRLIHVRRRMIGGSLSRAVGKVTVRGDFALYRGEPYALANPSADATFIVADTASVLVGVDYFGRDWTFGVQANRADHIESLSAAALEPSRTELSLWVTRQTLGDRLTHSLLLIRRISEAADGMLEVKSDYRITERLIASAGVDWFSGDRRGLYGQFADQDRVFVRFRYFM